MTSEAEREVMAVTLMANAELAASVLRGDRLEGDSVTAAIAATRSLGLIVEDTLRTLVQQARAESHTWAEIGELLRVTRQAAFKRFADDGEPEIFDDVDVPPLEGAEQTALETLDDLLERRFTQLHTRFNARMGERFSPEVIESHRARLERRHGGVLEVGTPTVGTRLGYTFVDVPVAFEHDELLARVAFDVDGAVAGLALRPRG